jgi:hypothetical protein
MSDTKKPEPRPAVYIDLDGSATVPTSGDSVIVVYGAEIEILPEYVAYQLLDNPDAQRDQWGRVRWLPGTLVDHPDIAADVDRRAEAARVALDRYMRLGI